MPERSKPFPALLDIRFSGGVPFRTTRAQKNALSLTRRLVAAPGVGIADLDPNAVTLEALQLLHRVVLDAEMFQELSNDQRNGLIGR